jgi:uncharacterized protein YjbI with pentapeptide repeats
MENQEHLDILKQGIEIWNKWRQEHPDIQPDLGSARLSGTDLTGIDLSGANLSDADLSEATLMGADLRETSLDESNFNSADLSDTNLVGVDFSNVYLNGVDFSGADLSGANFSGLILFNGKINFNKANLSGADLSETFLGESNFSKANLNGANLKVAGLPRANFTKANLNKAKLYNANLSEAILSQANLSHADFELANLSGAILIRANLSHANFDSADLTRANLNKAICLSTCLINADLSNSDLSEANFSNADFTHADLGRSKLLGTNLTGAILTNCAIYGISAWDVQLEGAKQFDLIITLPDQPTITVDNLKIAQFIYLLLNNQEIRDVIDTIARKAVLILGRFTPERKAVLDALRDALRLHGYLPILFDFNKPSSRDLTEMVRTLAHMSRFIIADLSAPRSIPQELQAIVPHLAVPIQPLLSGSKREYGMFSDFKKYPWVLPVYRYKNIADLLASLKESIIDPVEQKAKELEKR